MENLPTLDAHAHLHPSRSPGEVADSGAVLAMTLSLDEAAIAIKRCDSLIAWGAGCHPRFLRFQEGFDAGRFREIIEQTAVAGEIGLDSGSRVPMERQLHTFRQALDVLECCPRLISIHSYKATGLVLAELRSRAELHSRTEPGNLVSVPVLHWWTGTAAETREAVRLGCYFSIHSQVARQSKFRSWVPLERVLIESDHGQNDPPAAIPCRVQWVEYLVAQQYGVDVKKIRLAAWQNLAAIIHQTGTANLLPERLAEILAALPAVEPGQRWAQERILPEA